MLNHHAHHPNHGPRRPSRWLPVLGALWLAGPLASMSCLVETGDAGDHDSTIRTTASAALTSGPVYDKWMSLGGPNSFLGNPSTDELGVPDGRGRFAHFHGLVGIRNATPPGSIYWTPTTGAHPVSGQIRNKWSELGWERGALGYPNSDEFPWGQGVAQTFEGGDIVWDSVFVNRIRFFAQNMALLAAPASYKGHDRAAAKKGLIAFLRLERPHVVGLSEVFVDSERQEIKDAVADIYPFTMEGPDEDDLESDGGLLLLSQFALAGKDQTIYRACRGEDCLANKGVLKARVDLPGDRDVEVYLTHLQSPNPLDGTLNSGPGSSGPDKVKNQLTVLGQFIAATRDRSFPALLMGDINVNGRDAALYNDMMTRLFHPTDAWLSLRRDGFDLVNGITNSDPVSSFKPDTVVRPVNDPARFQSGNRLDYMFAYDGTLFRPVLEGTSVVVVQTADGRDISDHYGVMTRLSNISRLHAGFRNNPLSVTASLSNFHCLKETGGPLGTTSRLLGSDEVEFRIRLTPASGTAVTSRKSGIQSHVDRGTNRNVNSPPPPITVANPGSSVTVMVEGWEVDTLDVGFVSGVIDRAHLGATNMTLPTRELYEAFRAPILRRMILRSKAGGEYIMTVSLSVK